MLLYATIGFHLAIISSLFVYVVLLKVEIHNLRKENGAITKVAKSLMSGKSETPNPFPT
jgi:hypothetical protein